MSDKVKQFWCSFKENDISQFKALFWLVIIVMIWSINTFTANIDLLRVTIKEAAECTGNK